MIKLHTRTQPIFASLGRAGCILPAVAADNRVCIQCSMLTLWIFKARPMLKVRLRNKYYHSQNLRLRPSACPIPCIILRCVSVLFLHLIDTHTCLLCYISKPNSNVRTKIRPEPRHQFRSHFITDPVHVLLGQSQ